LALEKRLDKIEDMIHALQVVGIGSGRETPAPKSSLKSPQRQFPTSQPSGEGQDKSPRNQNRRRFVRPFDADVTGQKRIRWWIWLPSGEGHSEPEPEPCERRRNYRTGTQRPPGVPPGVCWVCRQPRCHSRFHEEENRQPSPPPRPRTPDVCWTCGQQGCRSWYHAPRTPTPVPLMSQSGNVSGTRNSGNRGPTQ